MKRRGMLFVGLDVIGDYLTEVNVTSPTCIRELDAQFGLNIAGLLFDAIEARARGGAAAGRRDRRTLMSAVAARAAPQIGEKERLSATLVLSLLLHGMLILGWASRWRTPRRCCRPWT